MSQRRSDARAPRTVLESKIWERNETLAEFAEYAEQFARRIGEPGTLSERNLKRLVSGQKPDGNPMGRPRPATARLLERIFGLSIGDLLSAPDSPRVDTEHELRQRLAGARRIDRPILSVFRSQLDAMRRIDRELGATIAHDEVAAKIRQVTGLQSHSLTPYGREQLSAILAELRTLAGWQALDLGNMTEAWQHYEYAKAAARESGLPELEAHATAEQAFVLLDLGEGTAAVQALETTRRATRNTGLQLRSWLAAAHGEALANAGQRGDSLRAFDQAATLLPIAQTAPIGPYIVLDEAHLARWRGNALARIGSREAVPVLKVALRGLDATYVRAEVGLFVDLAFAFEALGEREAAQAHLARARLLATEISSIRQHRRLKQFSLGARVTSSIRADVSKAVG